ncbi:MAG: chromosome segregation protein SMC [Chloroflexi bacterium]|nr:chromosome segregation protein SMC [Chloroflexota bacterium]
MLRRLAIHGFKTFAGRTVFEFHDGITAVIGPNGSGKSNLADAVRWVLGETSHSALRSKKVEDVIFAGSSARPAMGMAEVSLTLANADRLLDSDFAEVTITRRAFRDGETQYLLNGARVRLKDIVELTAPLGGAYTVVGQGLVDAALSLRPEERRGLFEHAAGITSHQLKRTEAERRLVAAEANCVRLTDILAELTPHLRHLERQARQAGEASDVRAALTAALGRWYGRHWAAATAVVEAAERRAAEAGRCLTVDRAAVTAAEATRAEARQRLAGARADGERARAERATRTRERADATRRAAVAAERRSALQSRLDDEMSDDAATSQRRAETAARLAETAAGLTALDEEEQGARARLAQVETEARVAETARAEAERALATLRQAVLAGATQTGALETALARVQERLAALDRDDERAADDASERQAERTRLLARQATLVAEASAAAEQRAALVARQAALAEEIVTLDTALEDCRRQRAAVEHDLTRDRARLEALTRLHDSGAGLAAGPKAVLAAARAGALAGILGPVAALIHAPAHLDTALEVALGGHVQDIVVAGWADAEAAIAHLKATGAGRATFQPLDTVRPPRPLAPASGPGIVGVATALVSFESHFQPLVQALLGRVLIVDDLGAARRLIARGDGWTLVTLAGEIARPGGAVSGGAAVREAGVLARERDRRDLPVRLDAHAARAAALDTTLTERGQARSALARARDATVAALADQTRDDARRDDARRRLDADLVALDAAVTAAERQRADATKRRAALREEQARQAAALATAAADQVQRQAALDRATAATPALSQRRAAATGALAEARQQVARLDERRRAVIARRADLTAQQQRWERDEQIAAQRRAALGRDLTAAAAEHATQAATHARLATALAAAEAAGSDLQVALAAADTAADAADRHLTATQTAHAAREAEVGRLEVAAEHSRGDLAALATRIEADLPAIDPATLTAPATDEPRLEMTIASLRDRLRRIGLVDPAVVDEYAATRERHAFLTRELADIEAAARSLRGAIGELDSLMRTRFTATFEAVNAAFGHTFSRLFNGGSARLVLTDDREAPGIDILAQPPGKRMQSLALLSGGERALTAAALLFAIVRVNPSPFCLLDEVDAALDESNVLRFRALLADLADRTQFVVITHNRGTIEGADTLYGISMGQDGMSQVISLRLEGAGADQPAPRAADD